MVAILKLPQVVPFNLKPPFMALLLLLALVCSSCKTPIVVEPPLQGEIELNPFCVVTVDDVDRGELPSRVLVKVHCKDGYKFSTQKAYGELKYSQYILDTIKEEGGIILTREQFQGLVVSLVEAGLIEVR